MKILIYLIYLLNFVAGVSFGNIGHIFSVLIFPLIAVLHGFLLVKINAKIFQVYLTLFIAGFILLLGLGIGLSIASNNFLQSDEVEIVSKNLLNRAINMGYFTLIIYYLAYVIIGLISYYFLNSYKSVNKIINNGKNGDDKNEV